MAANGIIAWTPNQTLVQGVAFIGMKTRRAIPHVEEVGTKPHECFGDPVVDVQLFLCLYNMDYDTY